MGIGGVDLGIEENNASFDINQAIFKSGFLSSEEIAQVHEYHTNLSKALGHPIGYVNLLQTLNSRQKSAKSLYYFESLYERQQSLLLNLLESSSSNLDFQISEAMGT